MHRLLVYICFTLSSSLLTPTLSRVFKPKCSNPPPPSASLPTLEDCYLLLEDIYAISTLEDNEPHIWTRHPNGRPATRQLPFEFTMEHNDCGILVDTLTNDTAEDSFSTKAVGACGLQVTKACLEGKTEGEASIGASAVGKKGQLGVFVIKNIPVPMSGSVGLGRAGALNLKVIESEILGKGSNGTADLEEVSTS